MPAKKPFATVSQPSNQPGLESPEATAIPYPQRPSAPTISGKSDLTYNVACDPRRPSTSGRRQFRRGILSRSGSR